MIGDLMGGMPREGEQPLESQWGEVLKRPEIQAGLLNFGIELMKPRWTSASALPDALSAGARGYAGVQQEEYNRQQEVAQQERAAGEKAADRENRMQIAELGADSRAEVQGLRNTAMMEGINARAGLKKELQGGFTPQENSRYNTLVKAFLDGRKNDLTRMGEAIDEKKLTEEAAATARSIVIGERVQGGGGGDIPSANGPPAGGTPPPVGQPGATQTPKITSANPSNTPPDMPTAADAIAKLKAAGKWPLPPAGLEWLKTRVKDPAVLDAFTGGRSTTVPPANSTMDGF